MSSISQEYFVSPPSCASPINRYSLCFTTTKYQTHSHDCILLHNAKWLYWVADEPSGLVRTGKITRWMETRSWSRESNKDKYSWTGGYTVAVAGGYKVVFRLLQWRVWLLLWRRKGKCKTVVVAQEDLTVAVAQDGLAVAWEGVSVVLSSQSRFLY